MKIKNIKKISSVLSIIALGILSSCDIGLGPAVDLAAPEIEVTSHKDNDAVGPVFVIRGKATDNEKVTKITIDFSDADIHYQVIPGTGEWQKKLYGQGWQTVTGNSNFNCSVNGNNVEWSIEVNTADKNPTKGDNSFTFEANASDEAGNSGRKSKAICTLTVDTESPEVSVYKPELFGGEYSSIETSTSGYNLEDGNVISRLMNGTIVLSGRQDVALSFKALRIEFDNGKLASTVRKVTKGNAVNSMEELLVLPEAGLGDLSAPTVYYSKNITGVDLREWSLTVKPEDWVNSSNGLDTGKHIIRVVSTSLSSSNAWERKILGYFIWWPESDKPWITAATGAAENEEPVECYPGSTISGSAQDDDGIKSLVSTVSKFNEATGSYEKYSVSGYTNPISHTLPQKDAKYSAWSIKVPSGNGKYKYQTTVEDLYGNKKSVEKYFKTSDVSAPKVEIIFPSDNSSAIIDASGDITFRVKAEDDGEIKNFAMVWLNPALRSTPSNKIKYLTGNDTVWNNASVDGYTDTNGNIIYRLNDSQAKSSYDVSKKVNLFTDFNIGQTVDGKERPLCAQDFIFLASDGKSNTVKAITLSGDTLSPELGFTDITIGGSNKAFTENGEIPTFPFSAKGKEAVITGKWKDMFNSSIENKEKLNLTVKWGDNTATATLNTTDLTWTAKIIAPEGGGTITATLKDFGGNTKIVQEAAGIESAESGLSRIDCLSDDGSYNDGKKIKLTLEFTKNTNVTGSPTLSLSNGGTAVYDSGSGGTSHVFIYTVPASTSADTDALYVKAINPNGAVWTEAATNLDISSKVTIPSDNIELRDNIKRTRKIKIDNTKPKVKSVTARSSTGYYKAGGTILFMLEFTEDVEVTDVGNLKMEFKHVNGDSNVKTDEATTAGSRYVLLTYKVTAGDNASPVQFNKLIGKDVKVKDNAGNEIESSWTLDPAPAFANIVVDTKAPDAPVFKIPSSNDSWNPSALITDATGTSFVITGENSASIEYSLDDGTNWLPYGNGVGRANPTISITNNGTYHVKARQTDPAGNVSDATATKSFTINKGELLNRITATTTSGTYTDNKTGVPANDVYINGRIEFRTAVTIPKGATVTLNARNSSGANIVVPLEECKNVAATATSFAFKYKVSSGDNIPVNNGVLDVTEWSLGATKLGSDSVTIDFPGSGSSKRLSKNREIKILTGNVEVAKKADGTTDDITFTGEGKNAVLTIKFNRNISKVNGDIVFRYYDTVSDDSVTEETITDTTVSDFHVPVVLTAEEYNELAAVSTVIRNAYILGMNGATKDSDDYLKNDTSTKYILAYDKTDTNEDVVGAFKAAKKNIINVPVISDAVSVNGNILKVELGSTYTLPVKGAKYKITIPQGAVTDSVQNGNSIISFTKVSEGVESPQIRINKTAYTITGTEGNTPSRNAQMSSAQKAFMKISCRTPNAALKYDINEQESTVIRVNKSPQKFDTLTRNVKVRSADTEYTGEVTLGKESAVDTYDGATGLKIAICASATVNEKTAVAYEFANRTVLKFVISGKYDKGEGSCEKETRIQEGESALKFKDLRVWIIGGDSTAGTNSLDPFPLSWGDNKNFKLMEQESIDKTYTDGNLYNRWWWVTWDLSAAAYHGFVLGDVPSDAGTDGPTIWYAGECAWAALKNDYILYPGETLIMAIEEDGTYHNSYLFRLKNEGHR